MKRSLALGAVALLMSGASAMAASHVISFTAPNPAGGTITCQLTINNFSDSAVTITNPVIMTETSVGTNCGTSTGSGMIGKFTIAKGVTVEAGVMGVTNSLEAGGFTAQIQYPIVNNGQYAFSYYKTPKSIGFANAGTYTLIK